MTSPSHPTAAQKATAYDKTGREIFAGDTLKVFHFTGARRKRLFMYKYVQEGPTQAGRYMRIAHLDPKGGAYLFLCDGKCHADIEIVQGYGTDGKPFSDRPKVKTP